MTTNNSINTSTNIFFTNVVVKTFTTSSTYTPTTNMDYCTVQIVGGGGGSGGVKNASSSAAASGGGGGSGYCSKTYTSSQIGANAAVVIGTGGSAGASTPVAGGNGVDSTFTPSGSGVVLTASGGIGGQGMTATSTFLAVSGGAGGTGTNGDLNINGSDGTCGYVFSGSGTALPGIGGQSYLGDCCICPTANQISIGNFPYGVGGAGRISTTSSGSGSGGGAGICYITEYIHS